MHSSCNALNHNFSLAAPVLFYHDSTLGGLVEAHFSHQECWCLGRTGSSERDLDSRQSDDKR